MSELFWQIFAVVALVTMVALLSYYITSATQRDRMRIEAELQRNSPSFRAELIPEREYLDRHIRELYDGFARTSSQVERLNEIIATSLGATQSVSQPASSFSRSVEIAKGSKFLRGLGFDASEVEPEGYIFYLTPFSRMEEETFQTVRKAALQLGVPLFRASEKFAGDSVLLAIVKSIVECRFVIANINGRNPNVFYELGIAQMLEKRTILISRVDQPPDFNVSHQGIVFYESYPELEHRLTQAIARSGFDSALT